ncbi:MAG TPA: DoxX family membrane protein [Terracidiphilus sp.]|nr:DoxX family membrane protein [Terracidiphilus sp.]
MKIAAMVARILLGLLMVFAGSNHLYAFMPSPPPPPGLAGQFVTVMTSSHYLFIVGICEVVPGILLLVNRYIPLALTVLGAVIVNILLTGILLAPVGIPAGVVAAILWFVVFWRVRAAFAGIFEARVAA